jgi:hypothetical protein
MTTNDLKLYHATASPNFAPRTDVYCREGHRIAAGGGRSRQGRTTLRCLSRYKSATRRPTLVLPDGTAIGEVLAIWRYLEEAYPTPALLGSTPKIKRW